MTRWTILIFSAALLLCNQALGADKQLKSADMKTTGASTVPAAKAPRPAPPQEAKDEMSSIERNRREILRSDAAQDALPDLASRDVRRALLAKIRHDLDLSPAQIREMDRILESTTADVENRHRKDFPEILDDQTRDMVAQMTDAQKEIAAGLYLNRALSEPLAPGPVQSGFGKWSPGYRKVKSLTPEMAPIAPPIELNKDQD